MDQGIIDTAPCVTLIQEFLNTYQRYFHFQYWSIKIFQNFSFTLLGLPLK